MPGKKGNFTAQTWSMACGCGPGWSRQDAGARDEFISASGYMKESISDR